MSKRKKRIRNLFAKKKKNKNQDSVTIMISEDRKERIFPVNCSNKDIKKRILKSI